MKRFISVIAAAVALISTPALAQHSNHGAMKMPKAPIIKARPAPLPLIGEKPILDNFPTMNHIEAGEGPHPSPDAVGAFRFTCQAGHLAYDDPIVYPKQRGVSHLHQFFGNTATNGNTTYTTLRTQGGSSCARGVTETPQRSAYWMPAMLDGAGNAIKPDWINTYYKQLPASDPECAKLQNATTGAVIPTGGKCVPIPNGIRFLVGYNMTTGANDFTNPEMREYWAMGYDCTATSEQPTASIPHTERTIAAVVAAGCPSGAWLRAFATFPQCWDGVNLDSPDHRAHIAFPVQSYCPPSHPYKFSEVAVSVHFRTDANFLAGKWELSADVGRTLPNGQPVPKGTTLHFDYWEGWSATIKTLWQKGCIDEHRSCSNGNLGDSRAIVGMQQIGPWPYELPGYNNKVPISSIPRPMK
jgi:hypothetical protein